MDDKDTPTFDDVDTDSTGLKENKMRASGIPDYLRDGDLAILAKCSHGKNAMSIEELRLRFKRFAINVASLIRALPGNTINAAYSSQLVRSSSSSGAIYRAACRAKSTADFVNKLKIVEEELDESIFFLELLRHFNPRFDDDFKQPLGEGNELLAITVASLKTARSNMFKSQTQRRNPR